MSTNDPKPKELIEAIANIVIAHADELTELDRVIGDADHGVNLTRGFRAVRERMDIIGVMPLGKALGEVGTTLIRFVGGATSPRGRQCPWWPAKAGLPSSASGAGGLWTRVRDPVN